MTSSTGASLRKQAVTVHVHEEHSGGSSITSEFSVPANVVAVQSFDEIPNDMAALRSSTPRPPHLFTLADALPNFSMDCVLCFCLLCWRGFSFIRMCPLRICIFIPFRCGLSHFALEDPSKFSHNHLVLSVPTLEVDLYGSPLSLPSAFYIS